MAWGKLDTTCIRALVGEERRVCVHGNAIGDLCDWRLRLGDGRNRRVDADGRKPCSHYGDGELLVVDQTASSLSLTLLASHRVDFHH